MQNSNTGGNARGISLLGMLALIFITLKLLGYITWPWWWVISPLWVPAACFAVLGIFCLLFAWIFN